MQVLFSENHRACAVQAPDDFRVLIWNTVFEERAGRRGVNAGGIEDVLEPDWNAMERAAIFAAKNFLLGPPRLVKRRLGQDRNEGVQLRIELLNTIEALVRQFRGRDLPRANSVTEALDGRLQSNPQNRSALVELLKII